MAAGLDLVHDVLDMQLVDRHGERMGRVDGLVLELRDDAPPRVATIVSGDGAVARRLGRRMSRLAAWLRRVSRAPSPGPTVIPFESVRAIEHVIIVELDATQTPSLAVECWLREHVVERLPGGGE